MCHVDQPRLRSSNRKSERSTVNEMKSALFSQTRNDHVAVYAGAEIFAAIVVSQVTKVAIVSPI
jgi:hypothetical protein